jgi:hypothetical protein
MKADKYIAVMDRVAIFLLVCFFAIKLVTCLTGCGDMESPPTQDGYHQVFIDAGPSLLPDSHQIICGDRLCESPWETMTNCPKDCLPKPNKADNPFDPGFIDPIDPPWRK